MDEAIQPDAIEECFRQAFPSKPDRTNRARQSRFRRKNPAKAYASLVRWRRRKGRAWLQKQRLYMAWRRKAAKESVLED